MKTEIEFSQVLNFSPAEIETAKQRALEKFARLISTQFEVDDERISTGYLRELYCEELVMLAHQKYFSQIMQDSEVC